MTKKILLTFLFLSFCLFPIITKAQNTTTLTMRQVEATTRGAGVNVQILLSTNSKTIGAVDLNLTYSSTVFERPSVLPASDFDQNLAIDFGANSIHIARGKTAGINQDNLVIATLAFPIKSSGESSISVEGNAVDTLGERTVLSQSLEITNNSAPTVDPSKSKVTFSSTNVRANGKDNICVTIEVKDNNGNAITNQQPTIEAGSRVDKSSPALSGNIWRTCLTSRVVLTVPVSVSAGGIMLSRTNVTFRALKWYEQISRTNIPFGSLKDRFLRLF